MSKGAKILISLLLGVLAAIFGMLYLSSKRDELLGSSEVVKVYVAAQDIPANTPLDPGQLTIRQVPKTFLQPQSITTAEIPDKAKIKGVTIVPIKQDEQIIRTKLWEGLEPPLSADLKERPNMVAVSVGTRTLSQALTGLVKPGDRVDVLASFNFDKGQNDHFTEVRPLFLDVEVLAVNDKTQSARIVVPTKPGEEQPATAIPKTVTLSVPPSAAQQLVLAQQLGDIWLILRAPGDHAPHQYEIWNNERLLQSPYRLWEAKSQQQEMMDKVRAAAGVR